MHKQCLNDAERNGGWAALLRYQARYADGAIDERPDVAANVQADEEIAPKQRPAHVRQTPSMPNCLLDLRQKRCQSLRFEIELGFSLTIWPRMNEIPTDAL